MHEVYLEDAEDEESALDQTEIHIDPAYTSFILVKTVRTKKLIREYEEDYENILFKEDPDKDKSCSLCGRTKSKEEILGKLKSDPAKEEIRRPTLNLCQSCSRLIKDKLTYELGEKYSSELAIKNI